MYLRIKRRRFGQLAIATASTTILANIKHKAFAQNSNSIYGVKIKQNLVRDFLKSANSTPGIEIKLSDIMAGEARLVSELLPTTVKNSNVLSQTATKAFYLISYERLTSATFTPKGTLIVASVVSSQQGDVTRISIIENNLLSLLGQGLKITGFSQKNSTIESLLATKDNKLLSIVSLNEGKPPFQLSYLDIEKGQIISDPKLGLPDILPDQRISNLTQAPDGKIYAILLEREIPPTLVQLDLEYKSPATGKGRIIKLVQLRFKNQTLGNDLLSLAFSPSGMLYTLANINGLEKTNALFSINLKDGGLNFLKNLDVDKIAFQQS